ncbi:MAG: NUDIX hydrolase, partial [Tenericutes bacterium HGW-Tenericutes-8]
ILGIDVIYVENHIKNGKFVGDHLHLNATYLLVADENEKLIVKEDENSGVKWFYINEVNDHVTEERIKTVYNKLPNRIKDMPHLS